MAAATRKPAASKKRKLVDQESAKKKSPLFNQPQNFYAPPSISSMSKEELTEWRKEQRRKRNRESAAASRNKTRVRIEELEGEVDMWRQMHDEMRSKMECMERHIKFLTQLNNSQMPQQVAMAVSPAPTVVSHPNSPPRSPQRSAFEAVPDVATSIVPSPPVFVSNANPANTTLLFPALLSDSKDATLVEKQEAAAHAAKPKEDPRKHLKPIPRQAVKITGVSLDSSVGHPKQQQQLYSVLPVCNSTAKNKMNEEGWSVASSGSPDDTSVEGMAVGVNTLMDQEKTEVIDYSGDGPTLLENTTLDSSEGDEDFLDLLVDTLDGDFDPNLLI